MSNFKKLTAYTDAPCEWVSAVVPYNNEIDQLKAKNAKLRKQTELLVTLLRNDCDIEASWDGLRHFWSIELTDDGCLMRDRACKAEAENAKLQASNEVIAEDHAVLCEHNAKLRELVRDMWRFTGVACKRYPRLFDPAAQGGQMVQLNMIDAFEQRMRELGVEVE